jgi:hydrogenase small subunit
LIIVYIITYHKIFKEGSSLFNCLRGSKKFSEISMRGEQMKSMVFTRRQFLKLTMGAAASLGISSIPMADQLLGDDSRSVKPAVVWMEAQDCTGCTESVLSCLTPDLRDVILDVIALRYHETIMAGTGHVAEGALDAAITEGGYVLVVEGSFPAADERYLNIAGHSLESKFVQAANSAAVILAVGACAAYGGIPRAGVPNGQGVEYYMNKYNINKTLINLPGCPVHPAWFFDTVLDYLAGNSIPLDQYKRPLKHFARKVHDTCHRRPHYDVGNYLYDWNKASERHFCLLMKGCKGPETHADCPTIKWNDGVNWCGENNAPCAGCTEPKFYEDFSPLYVGTVEKTTKGR